MTRTTDFDRDTVIEKAMHVFWNKGYEGTSMSDLIKATGLLKGSIYNTFKSKENLFMLCLEKYGNNSSSFHYQKGDPSEYLKAFFTKLIDEGARKDFTRGCLVMNSCMEFADSGSPPEKRAKSLFMATENNLKKVVTAVIEDSSSESEIEKKKIALLSAAFSIREISKFKKDKKFLRQIANNALKDLFLEI